LRPLILDGDMATLVNSFTVRRPRIALWWLGVLLLGSPAVLDEIILWLQTTEGQRGLGLSASSWPNTNGFNLDRISKLILGRRCHLFISAQRKTQFLGLTFFVVGLIASCKAKSGAEASLGAPSAIYPQVGRGTGYLAVAETGLEASQYLHWVLSQLLPGFEKHRWRKYWNILPSGW